MVIQMKKIISLILTCLVIISLSTQAFAVRSDDVFSETNMSDTNEETARITPISYVNWQKLSLQIPNSTSMLSKGIVNDGIITYQVTIRTRVLLNGAAYGNKASKWATSAPSSSVIIVESDAKTDGAGYTQATFQIRGMEKFPISVTCAGVEGKKTIDLGTIAMYSSDFQITQYMVADESDYTGKKISVSGLTGTYKSDFLADVKMQGSGLGEDGRYVKYYNRYYYQEPTTATGTKPTAGKTIAVDPYYIPCVVKNGVPKRGYVDISKSFGRRIAEDTGGLIKQFHIDVFTGVGKKSLDYSLPNSSRVQFRGVNNWGTSGSSPVYLEEGGDSQETNQNVMSGQPKYQSIDGSYTAYVSSIDYSKPNSVTVSVESNLDERNNSTDFELNCSVLSVDSININNDILSVTGYVNPSLRVYQRFDIKNQELIDEYYGYLFAETDDGIYYVQAPPHFSGQRGGSRILNEKGDVLYEAAEETTISELSVSGNELVFSEIDSNTGDVIEKSISTLTPALAIEGFY